MPSDRDTLLSMGFDPSRVDCQSNLPNVVSNAEHTNASTVTDLRLGALRATGGRGLQPAMDHVFEHEGEPVPDPNSSATSASTSGGGDQPMDVDVDVDDEDAEALRSLIKEGSAGGGDVEARSIKCSICSKTFRNTALANYHAEKSGHDQFEESTEEV
ncbi:hypothetical protein PAXINDRAFT_103529 [Paxillus involutus ATCC 200175]|uniref:C2H2-type domain-containing protein n=1 Tax=Paxillus involutus ATCC 200175 TaxID=664439 RepID=A0A0C9SUD8_PAXIN|nr:hypothetical protein PAXINDRAFT_103529 [Paxillus involutus ATCC 200175]